MADTLVRGTSTNGANIGGLFGYVNEGFIFNCHNFGFSSDHSNPIVDSKGIGVSVGGVAGSVSNTQVNKVGSFAGSFSVQA